MPNIDRAIELLRSETFTCVFVRDKLEYGSSERGVDPILNMIDENYDIRGCAVADKVLGKAAALLLVFAGVSAAFGEVMSLGAWKVLSSNGVEFYFTKMVENITNREGTDVCPMEQAVADISDPAEALEAIRKRRAELRGQASGG